MAKRKDKRGGKRVNAGRYKLPDGEAKKTVPLYFKEKVIEQLGADTLKTIATNAVLAEYEKRQDSIL